MYIYLYICVCKLKFKTALFSLLEQKERKCCRFSTFENLKFNTGRREFQDKIFDKGKCVKFNIC